MRGSVATAKRADNMVNVGVKSVRELQSESHHSSSRFIITAREMHHAASARSNYVSSHLMSRPSTESLPPAARAIALLLASTPTVQDAQPGVLHQLLEFSHRYTAQVLSDPLHIRYRIPSPWPPRSTRSLSHPCPKSSASVCRPQTSA